MDPIAAIKQGTSVRRYRSEPIPRDIVEHLLECAVRAPNHKLTQPWRFAVISGAAKERYAEIRARHRLTRFTEPASPEAATAADKVRREGPGRPPHIVAMTAVSA